MDEFDQFFKALAGRLRKENHLSDITYTTIKLVRPFKEDFVHFFFPKLNTNGDIEVIREFPLPSGDGQTDFLLRAESWDLIVENKIWDRNYHLGQYSARLEPNKPLYVGLIANHDVPIRETLLKTWQFRHWAKFVDVFSEKAQEYGQYRAVFEAYLTYVRKICTMAEFKKFTFVPESLSALTHFVRMAERAIQNTSTASYELAIKKGGFGDNFAGHWFELKTRQSKTPLNLWFGIDFTGDFELPVPAITIEVHKGENRTYFNVIEKAAFKSPSFEKKIRTKEHFVHLLMPAEDFKSLNADPLKESQLSKLCSFLSVCCDALSKSIR